MALPIPEPQITNFEEKLASRALWRVIKAPFVGLERAAPSATREFGQMGEKLERFVASEGTRSGMGRGSKNRIMGSWWDKNKELADDFLAQNPKNKLPADPRKFDAEGVVIPDQYQQMGKFDRFQQGVGEYNTSVKQKILNQK